MELTYIPGELCEDLHKRGLYEPSSPLGNFEHRRPARYSDLILCLNRAFDFVELSLNPLVIVTVVVEFPQLCIVSPDSPLQVYVHILL
jgi:hypothetical protein